MLLTRMIMGFYFFNFVIPCLDLEKKSGGGGLRTRFGMGISKISEGVGVWDLFLIIV